MFVVTPAHPTSSHMIFHCPSASFLTGKERGNRETDLGKNRRELLSLQGVVPPSLLFHGGVGLVRIGGHARAPTKPYEFGVYDSRVVSYLSCA
jgi:hypothetical protein